MYSRSNHLRENFEASKSWKQNFCNPQFHAEISMKRQSLTYTVSDFLISYAYRAYVLTEKIIVIDSFGADQNNFKRSTRHLWNWSLDWLHKFYIDSGIICFSLCSLKVKIKVEKTVPEMPQAVSYQLELDFGWIQLFPFKRLSPLTSLFLLQKVDTMQTVIQKIINWYGTIIIFMRI